MTSLLLPCLDGYSQPRQADKKYFGLQMRWRMQDFVFTVAKPRNSHLCYSGVESDHLTLSCSARGIRHTLEKCNAVWMPS